MPDARSAIRKRSSGSVTIYSLNKPLVMQRLREAARRLAEDRDEVEEVWLFGSLARGDAVPGSDADAVVVLTASEVPFWDRVPLYTLLGCGVGVDCFPYTRAELEEMAGTGHPFLKAIDRDKRVLYRRGDGAGES